MRRAIIYINETIKTMKNQPNIERLNYIQAEWMALDCFAPEAEKRRVFKLLDEYPNCYVSGHNGIGVCMIDGCPLSMPVPIESALESCKALGGRIDIIWNGKTGQWKSR